MGVLHGNPFLLASGTATEPTFPVQRSVRLRSSASAYLTRTPSSTTNRQTMTFSIWLKRGALSTIQNIYNATDNVTASSYFYFNASDILLYTDQVNSTQLTTTQVFRDPSSWYHFVFAIDTTQATAANRVKLYVNGVQITSFSTATYPAQNSNTGFNYASFKNDIGSYWTGSGQFFDGYMTEINFIDGQALTPSSFGGYNSGTGVWEPRKYSGTYGTNGFYLNFQDNSNNTATTIGKDSSGNSNNWTPTGISITSGVTYDSMLDVPTNTGNTNANFAVMNPLRKTNTVNPNVLSNGNLTVQIVGTTTGSTDGTLSSMPITGKKYIEFTLDTFTTGSTYLMLAGIADLFTASNYNYSLSVIGSYAGSGTTNGLVSFTGTSSTLSAFTPATNDVYGFAIDADTGKCWFRRNSSSWVSGDPVAGTSPSKTFSNTSALHAIVEGREATNKVHVNFGQRPFSYAPPSGYTSLNTFNLPEPTIPSGDDYHKVYTYTGNGGGLQVGEIQKPLSAFNLDRSLRLRASASACLSRTPSSAGNRTTWTWSGWVKRGRLGTTQDIISTAQSFGSNNNNFRFFFDSADKLFVYNDPLASQNCYLNTNAVFRDTSLWYHIVLIWNTTDASLGNRVQIWVNGINQSLNYITSPAQNIQSFWNLNQFHQIGQYSGNGGGLFLDGYLADIYFIDGQPITPTSFGQFDGNNYWTPKAYTGTYGTNGFHLEFEDFSAATAAAIGKDTSGQVNNWTPTNVNLTTPANTNASWDSMVDVPTQTSTDVANFATLNPLRLGGVITLSAGNLQYAASSGNSFCSSSIGVNSGKWYCEIFMTSAGTAALPGIVNENASTASYPGGNTNGYGYYYDGNKYNNGAGTAYGSSYTTNDTIGIALDLVTGKVWFSKNGVWQASGDPAAGTNAAFTGINLTNTWFFACGNSGVTTQNINFGQRPFRYTPPTEFKTLNSFNVAEVTTDIESPDFVWIKSRSAGTGHALFNKVLGTGKYLSSNTTSGETTDVNSLIQFNKNGFLLGNAAIVNTSAATYVASAWKSGGTAVTNTAGTGTSLVSANQISGFSIVTMTNIPTTAGTNTYGHGLNNTPKLIIFKNKDLADSWYVYHDSLGNAAYIRLDLPNPQTTAASIWGTTSPTPSVFTLRNSSLNTNTSQTILAYCFAEIAGFSKFGKYTGNGVAEGPFLYTGFRPRWILFKAYDQTDNWIVFDSARDTYNVVGNLLYPNAVTTEQPSPPRVDFLANGFKIRSGANTPNGGNWNYIYAAFAENPFKYSLAR